MPRLKVPALPEHTASHALALLAPAPAGIPADAVPGGKRTKSLRRLGIPASLVLGSTGGAGTTTVALGLAAAATTRSGRTVAAVAVDATAWGGDLGRRGADVQVPVSTLQTWLRTPHPDRPTAVTACSGRSSTGVRILARDSAPLPRGQSFLSVRRHLETAGMLPIFDGGGQVASRDVASLIDDPRVGLVLVAAARADSLNALNDSLVWLCEHYGEWLIREVVIAVTYQLPGGFGCGAVEHVRTHLGSAVRAVVDIPYDPHLASRARLDWGRLSESTRQAYRTTLGGLQ
ncbi:hypothetical protein JK358_37370 [Nocardia sp. 2]|uniref:MinD-like ATPase involved in chromosome partitioning or flagellar assembly n=1 Tax=Nocardia acididurans TaxID=2802282 RepID=A0ABS1MHE4_9NOCA|nr:hypothetical protein [Nocardia acididurans]MBL1080083.1 hypothetical protein [Nocardia acididurans]